MPRPDASTLRGKRVCILRLAERLSLYPGDDEAAAKRFLEAAYDTFEFLAANPAIGRPRLEFGFEGLRSWRIQGFRGYLIFYREHTDRIQIWRVLHGARDLSQLI